MVRSGIGDMTNGQFWTGAAVLAVSQRFAPFPNRDDRYVGSGLLRRPSEGVDLLVPIQIITSDDAQDPISPKRMGRDGVEGAVPAVRGLVAGSSGG